jgi:putative sterol carrier protein
MTPEPYPPLAQGDGGKPGRRKRDMTRYDYLSPEWAAEVQKKLQADLPAEKMKFITTSMSNIYTKCPGGKVKYLFFKVEKGVFTEVRVGEGDPPAADFRITGDHELFSLISQAKMKSQRALMTGKLKLRGNMVKALKLASLADRMNAVIATVPTNY